VLVRQLAESLIEGMEAINAKMLHRDLKPDNILLDGDTPKIGDFGLSKLVGAATRSQTFKGGQQIFYMAPEGWKFDKNEIQIDMYALGIVLYEIAALKYPYKLPADLRDTNAIQNMHLFQPAPPLSGLRPDLPAPFCQAVAKLLEMRPQDRFAKWQDVRDAVSRAFGPPPAGAAVVPTINTLVATVCQLHDHYSKRALAEDASEAEEAQVAAAERVPGEEADRGAAYRGGRLQPVQPPGPDPVQRARARSGSSSCCPSVLVRCWSSFST